ncbi:hypothetical protein SAMN04488136_10290 [Vibrio xiamenensis]|uniref:Uncharacterized protein n=1 Tax=Vibrio xiamenensis TaxID=861298 RepID=A0A1G7WPN8_9VIBR|nr:DUF2057 family protein [Vibrio xiamenensis]SDG73838.1 hypothetical protein SAMN04488136_10290 [Vibrio xiamenensis]
MLSRIVSACALSALVSFSALASVELEIPDNVSVYVVNQDNPEFDSNFLGGDKTLSLSNGVNQILFQYIPAFVDRDNATKVYGQYIVAKFDAADTTLTFDLPNYRNARQANAEIDKLKWALKNSAGQSIPVVEDTLSIRGVTLGRDYIRDIEKYNQSGGKASLNMVTSSKTFSQSPQVQQTLDTFKQQYLKLNEQERKAFLQWAVSQ